MTTAPEPIGIHRGWSRRFSRIRRLPFSLKAGSAILIFYVFVALTGSLWAPYSPYETSDQALLGASLNHLLGTDILGRDIFSRVIYGTGRLLFLSIFSVALATLLGGAIGILSGFRGGWIDTITWRLLELWMVIPQLILVLLVIAGVGPAHSSSSFLIITLIILAYAPRTARMTRSIAVELSVQDFVTVARARGESSWSIARREIAPNATGVLLVEFGVRAGAAPLLISSLAFLGFGARPPSSEWGLMISENRSALVSAPLTVFGPLVALSIFVIGLNLFAEGLARVLGRSTSDIK